MAHAKAQLQTFMNMVMNCRLHNKRYFLEQLNSNLLLKEDSISKAYQELPFLPQKYRIMEQNSEVTDTHKHTGQLACHFQLSYY